MGGLVLGINVEANPGAPVSEPVAYRKIGFTVSAEPIREGHGSTVSTTLFDPGTGASLTGSPGPALILTQGEPVQIDVLNRMAEPTAIHWHGLELESYFDGVPGVGSNSRSVTPVIVPGSSFPVRLTPPRAGTFIYHTHWGHETQLTGGLYGPLIVVEPGKRFDAEAEKILLIGASELSWITSEILLNGERAPAAIELDAGRTYRLRLINIAPNHDVTVSLGSESDALAWRLVAKDGFELPSHQRRLGPANLLFSVGETYDYEFTPTRKGEFPLTVQSAFQKDGVIRSTLRVR
jgi:FtsP/CotA-like multicopper oxidase with cupredoxin domain